VAELHAAVMFGASISKGEMLRVIELKGANASDYKVSLGRVVGQQLIDVVRKLAVIQERVVALGVLSIRQGPYFTREELLNIDGWFSVFTTGRAASRNQVSFSMSRTGVKELLQKAEALRGQQEASGEFQMLTTSDEPLRVFNLEVPIAAVHRTFRCKLDAENCTGLKKALREAPKGSEGIRVRLRMTAEEHYPEFVPPGTL
jgi:hypothetical protein